MRAITCHARASRTLDDVPELVDEVTDLLQHLIRNACVNDGNVASGHEARSVDTLRALSRPRRSRLRDATNPRRVATSLVARIEGTDPTRRRCCSWVTPTSCRSTPTAGGTTRSAAS